MGNKSFGIESCFETFEMGGSDVLLLKEWNGGATFYDQTHETKFYRYLHKSTRLSGLKFKFNKDM